MPIPDPLRDYTYETGGLLQACDECDWAQRGHRRELDSCPMCGEPLRAPLAIEFGGLAIVYHGRDFVLYDNTGQCVLVQRADCPEVVQFFARHAQDLRSGHAGAPPQGMQRVEKTRDFEQMLALRGGRRCRKVSVK